MQIILSILSGQLSQQQKGGIPTSAPHRPRAMLRRLPPILCICHRDSISSCSEAPWGLSVQSRVTCIFTGISISPGPSLRQCPNRYTFRAGRNLPDKEFRHTFYISSKYIAIIKSDLDFAVCVNIGFHAITAIF